MSAKVLLVEDNKNNLRAFTLYLEVMGLIVEQARDGFEALRKLNHETFDVVVSDIGMPGQTASIWQGVSTITSGEFQ